MKVLRHGFPRSQVDFMMLAGLDSCRNISITLSDHVGQFSKSAIWFQQLSDGRVIVGGRRLGSRRRSRDS